MVLNLELGSQVRRKLQNILRCLSALWTLAVPLYGVLLLEPRWTSVPLLHLCSSQVSAWNDLYSQSMDVLPYPALFTTPLIIQKKKKKEKSNRTSNLQGLVTLEITCLSFSFFLLWYNIGNIKFTILATFNCMAQLNNIPLCGYTLSCFCSSLDGRLHSCHLWLIVMNVAVNMCVQLSFQDGFPLS